MESAQDVLASLGLNFEVRVTSAHRTPAATADYVADAAARGCAIFKRRNALERINARIDDGFRFENHTIRGKAKMAVRVGLCLSVMMALGSVKAVRPSKDTNSPKNAQSGPCRRPNDTFKAPPAPTQSGTPRRKRAWLHSKRGPRKSLIADLLVRPLAMS